VISPAGEASLLIVAAFKSYFQLPRRLVRLVALILGSYFVDTTARRGSLSTDRTQQPASGLGNAAKLASDLLFQFSENRK
jgi:hypothetical protein